MPRILDEREFDRAYDQFIVAGRFQEVPEYYPRYRSRYRHLIRRLAQHGSSEPCDVLDIGGGQLGLLSALLWKDRATVADFPGPHFEYLSGHGVRTTSWDLCRDIQPFERVFDVVFLSEVIEHIPIPAHMVFERIRRALRPGGWFICSTPNLYRARNIVYLILGKRIFDYFRFPEDRGLGHVLEYSQEHLNWQLRRAGFDRVVVDLVELPHAPNHPGFRALAWLGTPLMLIPRLRGNLVAVAQNPTGETG